jgi:ribonuclease R
MGRRHKGRARAAKDRTPSVRHVHAAVTGVLHVVRSGTATVETAEGTFGVAPGGLREGMNGDLVGVTLARNQGERAPGLRPGRAPALP